MSMKESKFWGFVLFLVGLFAIITMLILLASAFQGCAHVESQDQLWTLTFTAPADDGNDPASGPVSEYRIYLHTEPITLGNIFTDAQLYDSPPTPVAPGEQQTFQVVVPANSTMYCVVIACDEVPNCSEMSNQVVFDIQSPDKITDLRTQ